MTIEFQPDKNSAYKYIPTAEKPIGLGQFGDMEMPVTVWAQADGPDTLGIFLQVGFSAVKPPSSSFDPHLRLLHRNEINDYQTGKLSNVFDPRSDQPSLLDHDVRKVLDNRFRWFEP